MQGLDPQALSAIWERGQGRSRAEIALQILGGALPHASRDDLLRLSVGQRDAALLRIRELTIGPDVRGGASCPRCAALLEFSFDTRDFLASVPSSPPDAEHRVVRAGLEVRVRSLTSQDLLMLHRAPSLEAARASLVRRCVLEAYMDGAPCGVDDLPDEVIEEIGELLAERDTLSDVRLRLDCPSCGHGWQAMFDVVSFFWREIAVRAERLFEDVHALAKAYGWSESAILTMSAAKRRVYLDLI